MGTSGIEFAASEQAVSRQGIELRCRETVSSSQDLVSALSVWDDGATAGVGVGYGDMSLDRLADLVASAERVGLAASGAV
jgi:hypothetical protein